MSLTLEVQVTNTQTISEVKITSFSVDLARNEIHIAYDELDNGVVISERVFELANDDFFAVITDASAIAGTDIYQPLKQALYNTLMQSTVYTKGVVS